MKKRYTRHRKKQRATSPPASHEKVQHEKVLLYCTFMPMYPERMDVMAPSTNATVVKAPSAHVDSSSPRLTRKNTTPPKMTTKMRQMVYSADKKASAPLRIAS